MTLRVTFLGTAAAVPTTDRNPSAIFVNRDGDGLLFDVGEGTQRQMIRFGTGFSVDAVFLTHLHGDHVYGLPGMLETWGFNGRTDPLPIYTPPRTRANIVSLITACGGEPAFPVTVNEISPGEPARNHDEYTVTAFATNHRTTGVGYALVEHERKGRFNRARAENLGVPPGPLYSRLHEGESVELTDGTVVTSDQVVGPPRPGRKVVISGDTRPTETVVEAAAGADVLIHDATFDDEHVERAKETGHSTAREAGRVAASAGVTKLVLTHISSRYAGDVSTLIAEAKQAFDGDVMAAEDGVTLEVPYPE